MFMGPTPALKSARRSAPHNPPMAHYVSGAGARTTPSMRLCSQDRAYGTWYVQVRLSCYVGPLGDPK